MSTPRDYYQVLEVPRGADDDEIRRAYRRLARRYHPDVNQDEAATRRFGEITEAYEVLSDPEKRRRYDRFGHAGVADGAGGPRAWSGDGMGGVPFDELFEQMFGGGSSFGAGGPQAPPRPRRGRHLRHAISVSFMTAALGGSEAVTVTGPGGAAQKIMLKIPPGIETGGRLRVPGQGEPGQHGGRPGDLIVTVTVGDHPWFRREGLDVLVDVPVTIAEAALGTEISVPLLEGQASLKVPPGASSGRKLRLRGKGIVDRQGRRGDLYAVVQIAAPRTLSPRAGELLRALGGELKNPRESGPWASRE